MKKVLIIDDDQLVANIYGNRFEVEGYQVQMTFDGEAASKLIKSFRPDAVILDLMLPKITGVELVKTVRAQPDFAKVPIIILSNSYRSRMMQDALDAGATKCLSKDDCTPRQLVEMVRSAIAGSGAPAPTTDADRRAVTGKTAPKR